MDQIGINWIKLDQTGLNWINWVQLGTNLIKLDEIGMIGSNLIKLLKLEGGGLSPTPTLSFALLSLIIEKLGLSLYCLKIFKLVGTIFIKIILKLTQYKKRASNNLKTYITILYNTWKDWAIRSQLFTTTYVIIETFWFWF